MKRILLTTIMCSMLVISACGNSKSTANSGQFVAGKDYTVLSQPGKTEAANKVEVREFFWYGCGHCYKLEPYMQKWLKDLPKDVYFVRTPAAMNPVWEQNARAYYTAEMLNAVPTTHIPLFKAIHEERKPLFDQKSLVDFYQSHGIDVQQFTNLYNSFAVTAKINQSNQLAKQYQVSGVPAVVVNGKYVVQGENQRVIDVINYLIEQERQPQKTAK